MISNNFENKEAKTVVKKVSEFSLDKLGLSKKTYDYVKNIPPEELILLVRTKQLFVKNMREVRYDELYTAIDITGFIRHDFDPKGFGANHLYRTIYEICPSKPHPYTKLEDFNTNEAYEDYRNPSQAQLQAINLMLDDTLSEREKYIMQLRFGLIDGKSQTLKEIGDRCNLTREGTRWIISKTLQKLRCSAARTRLEVILAYSSPEECNNHIEVIEKELDDLRWQMSILKEEILNIKKYSPFMSTRDIPEQPMPNLLSNIGVLGLSVRAHNCLIRTGIKTIGDFVEHCSKNPENWDKKIRYLGKKCAQEVAEKVTALGWQIPMINLS